MFIASAPGLTRFTFAFKKHSNKSSLRLHSQVLLFTGVHVVFWFKMNTTKNY